MRISILKKKFMWVLASLVLGVLTASAVPAHPRPVEVMQSDGSKLTVRLVGDEFFHRTMTTDGYTVLKDARGDYVYAQEDGARLVPSNVIAHNPQMRSAGELKLLTTLQKGLADKTMLASGKSMRGNRDKMMASNRTDYQNFRGLVILINYSDRSFVYGNDYFDAMMNQRNYTGYYSTEGYFVPCTGSARDYYYDNSMGAFDPQFDIFGPVNVNYTSTTPQGYDNVSDIFVSAVNALNPTVDFSQYDGDGDGVVDMIYFVVAGYTANFSGNDSGYLWPHQYYMYYYTDQKYDGVYLGRYACSGEIYGWEAYGYTEPDGIGTMVHEFTHVLGIMDLYDTDYGTNGSANDPAEWDVMSGGSYNDYSHTPAGFTIWERFRLGFADIELISEKKPGYTLGPVNETNTGYWIQTQNENEYFILDNRQQTGWDTYIPGHGLMVVRVEYNEDQWWNNTINANASHMYYELLRAGNGFGANPDDPFPGTNNVTTLNNLTTPSLRTWSGQDNEMGLYNIAENDGIITFGVGNGDGTVPTHEYELGDVNHDGKVAITDVTDLIAYLMTGQEICLICADVNEDGDVSIKDVTALINRLMNNQ